MNERKLLLQALTGTPTARPPVWLMRQAGRYLPEYREVRRGVKDFLELCYTPELAVEVTLQPIRRFGLDAAILFSDILVVPHAMGVDVRFIEKEGPQLEPVRSEAAVAALSISRLHGHLAPVYETVRRLRETLPDHVALIGFAGAPWTLAAYMVEGRGSRDFQSARVFARRHAAAFATMIALLTDAVIEYLSAQIEAGAEAVQLFDSWAGVLPPAELERWCLIPAKRIVAALAARHPGCPVILFPRGIGAGYLRFATESGSNCLALDTSVPIDWAARSLPNSLCIQGNLDPLALLGPTTTMLEEAQVILRHVRNRPHVFNLGHGLVPETPPEAVAALVRHLQSAE